MNRKGKAFVIILDGVGVGELPDADLYGDSGSNTLGNMAEAVGGLNLPALRSLGLGNITPIKGVDPVDNPLASFGKMREVSKGKDSTTGHWEIGGIHLDFDFSYFPEGFPESLMNTFLKETGCKGFLANRPASGTEIIKELGDRHCATGFPIVYTSADSVFQIAAHEEIIPLERLYEICRITRERVLKEPYVVGRVIARPFVGKSGSYTRTTNRKDYSLDPPSDTVLDMLMEQNIPTVAIGKINDLFNCRGIKIQEKTKSNSEGCNKLLEYASNSDDNFVFANLVDFDVYYGHRNDPEGFAKALKEFDGFLPTFIDALSEQDILIITSDHGNDPTTVSTDHSREYVPLLFYRKGSKGIDLGIRSSFSDVAKTITRYYGLKSELKGTSFLSAQL